jgi:hypothetical protein
MLKVDMHKMKKKYTLGDHPSILDFVVVDVP